jgi:hypothetical protein
MTGSGQSDGARLSVGVNLWESDADDGRYVLAHTERTESDEVGIFLAEGPTLYFSRAAAREVGQQLLDRADEKLERSR